MRAIARSTLSTFIETLSGHKHKASVKTALDAWYFEVESAAWRSSQDVKKVFGKASVLDHERIVFNIKGNSYRLITAIDYQRQIVFVKWLGSHREYDKIDARTVQNGDQTYQKCKRS